MSNEILTPEAVLTGLAFNFGSNTWQHKMEIPYNTKKNNRENKIDKIKNLPFYKQEVQQQWYQPVLVVM